MTVGASRVGTFLHNVGQAAAIPSLLYSLYPSPCAPVAPPSCAFPRRLLPRWVFFTACSRPDCTNCCLCERHRRLRLSHQLQPALISACRPGTGRGAPPPHTRVDRHVHWILSVLRGRPVLLIDSSSGALSSLAHPSAMSTDFCFHASGSNCVMGHFLRSHSQLGSV